MVIVTLALAFAGLATRGTAQGNGLPERYALATNFQSDADPTSFMTNLEKGAAKPGPFPPELGLTGELAGILAGMPYRPDLPDMIWPWIVFEGGRPVAMGLDLNSAAQPGLPKAQRIASVEGVEAIRELSYDRMGDRLSFGAVYGVAVREAGQMSMPGKLNREIVSEGVVTAGDRPGCFGVNLSRSNGKYARASLCLSLLGRYEGEGGSSFLHLKAEIEGVAGFKQVEETPFSVTRYAVAIPLEGAASAGAYITASGVDGFHAESLLEDINRFAASLEQSIARHEFDLAARQVESLNAYLADLEAAGARWQWTRRPTAAGVTRYNELMEAIELYRLAHLDTQARVNDVRQQLLVLRTNFSGNIVKSMLKSTINWMNVVPTDPVSGLAGYSDIAGALLLPQSLQSWKETADSDASILASQARAIRHFEALEVALAERLVDLTEARGDLFERIENNEEARALELDAALRSH
ncbi:hypothetical protein DZK27_04635 [Rhodobacteraceae bacterium 63075]|nr:hypothetical protein DZK27_04635 [Rhodobacteraceae bacterium 63075]